MKSFIAAAFATVVFAEEASTETTTETNIVYPRDLEKTIWAGAKAIDTSKQ